MTKEINKYAPYVILSFAAVVMHLPLMSMLILAGILSVISVLMDGIVWSDK